MRQYGLIHGLVRSVISRLAQSVPFNETYFETYNAGMPSTLRTDEVCLTSVDNLHNMIVQYVYVVTKHFCNNYPKSYH